MKYSEFKAPKGVIKVELSLSDDNTISKISLSGDFFIYPEEALEHLEKSLLGIKAEFSSLMSVIKNFYQKTGVSTPLIGPEHWVEAILRAVRS
ncbi:MAG: lipoate protein ligase C-terminal domain-containing protein [Candidatus Hadarchaeum sp.]|uniref:lipoate protein ligase C-terminal domain-containing protein n=1 Tax=Candidatus Hadarchaeum sp. TaxID=2883567 RepID=UPI00317A2759